MKTTRLLIGAAIVSLAGSTAIATAQVRGVTKTEIIIGTHTDLSGPAASYGVTSTNAIRMKIDEINKATVPHPREHLPDLVDDVDAHGTLRPPCPRASLSSCRSVGSWSCLTR